MVTAAIAGGQSLIPMLNLRVAIVDRLVDIGRLEALRRTVDGGDMISIGALTSHAEIEDGETPDHFDGLLRSVAKKISYRSVRHHGTIGGSVALADPSADWPPCLLALDAKLEIHGTAGTRVMPIDEVLQAAYVTALQPGDVLVNIQIKKPVGPFKWGTSKVVKKSGAFAMSIAVAVIQHGASPSTIVLGAAAPRPIKLDRISEIVGQGKCSEDTLRAEVTAEIARRVPTADDYELRMHTSTVLSAIRELQ
jgi:carbon-monoxide dehydrogenase medium subunit